MKTSPPELTAHITEMESQIRSTLVQCTGSPSHTEHVVQRMLDTRNRLGLQEYAVDLLTYDQLLHLGNTFPKKMCLYASLLGAEMLGTRTELLGTLDSADVHLGKIRVPKGKEFHPYRDRMTNEEGDRVFVDAGHFWMELKAKDSDEKLLWDPTALQFPFLEMTMKAIGADQMDPYYRRFYRTQEVRSMLPTAVSAKPSVIPAM